MARKRALPRALSNWIDQIPKLIRAADGNRVIVPVTTLKALYRYHRPKKGRRKGSTLQATDKELRNSLGADEQAFARKIKRHEKARQLKQALDAINTDPRIRKISKSQMERREQRLIDRGVKIEKPDRD